MRLQLNLNQYYDGLEDYQVNTLFGLFMGLKPRIEFLQGFIESGKTGESYFGTARAMSFSGFRQIDKFMQSVGKEPIFDIEGILSDVDQKYDAVPLQPLIDTYFFLISEPISEEIPVYQSSRTPPNRWAVNQSGPCPLI